ncbi:unnamed protein product [Closterium sp. NIES-53]
MPIAKKIDVLRGFQKWLVLVEQQSKKSVLMLCLDRGGEFLGKEFTDFVDGKGIVHDLTCPYSPQQNGMAEREMHTAVESARTMLLHMAVQHHYIVAIFDLNLMQLDMKNDFLKSKLDRVLYMYQPDYFDDGTGRVCKLLKSLYGLKQSPLLWYKALDGVLLGAGWKKSQVDEALYFKASNNGVTCWVLVYVDDLLAASSGPAMLKELKQLLEDAFELREISPVVKYLGLEIVRDRPARKLRLHQQGYADKLRRRFIDDEQGGRVPKTPVSVDAYAELTFDDE